MSELRILKGSKEQFIKEISDEIMSPLDSLLHDLVYIGWNSKTYNTYKIQESLIDIEDSEDVTKAYCKLKQALAEFEDVVNVKFIISPRGVNSIYNTIKEKSQ